jgi:hypothetical protein
VVIPQTPRHDFLHELHKLLRPATYLEIGVQTGRSLAQARPDGRTVAVFDDVLPYSPDIAGREPLPGDWTGDVWKIHEILTQNRPDLSLIMVDVAPTGLLVVLGLNPDNTQLTERYDRLTQIYTKPWSLPEAYTLRDWTLRPADALHKIQILMTNLEDQ